MTPPHLTKGTFVTCISLYVNLFAMQRVDKYYWLLLSEVTKLIFFGMVNGECKKCVRVCV